MPIKLNLGGGLGPALPGYIVVDRKTGGEIYPLRVPEEEAVKAGVPEAIHRVNSDANDRPHPETVDLVRASHCLEHLDHETAPRAVAEWVRALKPGGVLKIAVPNVRWVAEQIVSGADVNALGYLYGGQTDADDYHRTGFDEPRLRAVMTEAGLTDIKPWESEVQDCAALPCSLNLMGTKATAKAPVKPRTVAPDLKAVICLPRWSLPQTMVCVASLHAAGVPYVYSQGVFWYKAWTRMVEPLLSDGTEFVLSIDGDGTFTVADVRELARLIIENPGADAVCGVQCQRNYGNALCGVWDADGNPRLLPLSQFAGELTRVDSGHFGLTLFRTSSLNRLPRPWLMPVPDSRGGWGEGSVDPDMNFWRKWRNEGLTLFQANRVRVGHIQETITFPSADFSPQFVTVPEWEQGGMVAPEIK